MSDATGVIRKTVDLNAGIEPTHVGRLFAVGDSKAHTFRITVTADGVPKDMTSFTIKGLFLKPDHTTTIEINGTHDASNNAVVELELPSDCYADDGLFNLIVRAIDGEDTCTIFWAFGKITKLVGESRESASNLPSYETLEQEIEALNNLLGSDPQVILGSIADTYTPRKYEVGEYCLYQYQLYICAVEHVGETDFDATKWKAVPLSLELFNLKKVFEESSGITVLNFVSGYYAAKNVGDTVTGVTSNTGYVCAMAPYDGSKPILVNLYGASAARAWGYLNSNYEVLAIAPANTNYDDTTIPDAPEGTAYVFFNNRVGSYRPTGYYAQIGDFPVDMINDLSDRLSTGLSGINDLIHGKLCFAYNGTIADRTDLDTLYLNGWYLTPYNGSFPHSPDDRTAGRRLIMVFGLDNPSSSSVRSMLYFNFSRAFVAMRNYTSNGWGDWIPLSTKDYVDTEILTAKTELESEIESEVSGLRTTLEGEIEETNGYIDDSIAKIQNGSIHYVRCLSYEPYPDDTQGDYVKHPVRGCCVCGKKLMYNVYYRDDNPYYIGALNLGNRLYQYGANNKYNIVLSIDGVDTPMNTLTDGNGSRFDIVDMKSKDQYLYLALRGGTGYPDLSKINGYLVAIDTSSMSVIGYDTSPGKTSGIFVFENYLIVGEQSSGWSVYTLNNGVPQRVYRYAVASLTPYEGEWQQPCAFRANNTMYIAIARYTRGVDLYTFDETTYRATLVTNWDDLSSIGTDLNVFAVKANYPYLYATIAPKTQARTAGNNTIGLVTLNVSDTSNITYKFAKIPDAYCGVIPQYYSVATDGTLTLTGFGDPAPNCLWVYNGYVYTNNEDRGISVFKIASDDLEFVGNVDIGVWPKYFDMKQGVIFASTQYDYVCNRKPLITATHPII